MFFPRTRTFPKVQMACRSPVWRPCASSILLWPLETALLMEVVKASSWAMPWSRSSQLASLGKNRTFRFESPIWGANLWPASIFWNQKMQRGNRNMINIEKTLCTKTSGWFLLSGFPTNWWSASSFWLVKKNVNNMENKTKENQKPLPVTGHQFELFLIATVFPFLFFFFQIILIHHPMWSMVPCCTIFWPPLLQATLGAARVGSSGPPRWPPARRAEALLPRRAAPEPHLKPSREKIGLQKYTPNLGCC